MFSRSRSPSGAASAAVETVVAAVDAVRLPSAGRLARRELIDEREERQLLGIGEKEPAQAARRFAQLGVGLDLVEPLRHGPPGQIGGDRRIPPLLGEAVRSGQVLEGVRQPVPAAGRRPAHDAGLAGGIGPRVAEAAAQDPRELQPQLFRELLNLVLPLVNQIAARLRRAASR